MLQLNLQYVQQHANLANLIGHRQNLKRMRFLITF